MGRVKGCVVGIGGVGRSDRVGRESGGGGKVYVADVVHVHFKKLRWD